MLSHWRADLTMAVWATHGREDITGLYGVGATSLDDTDLRTARLFADGGESPYGIAFDVDERVTLTAGWGVE